MHIVFIFTFWYILLNFFHSGQWYPKYATSVSYVHSSYFNHLTILSLLVIFQILVACLHQQFYPSVMFDIQESLLCKVKTLPQPSPLKPWVIFHYQSAYSLFLWNFTWVSHSVLITTLWLYPNTWQTSVLKKTFILTSSSEVYCPSYSPSTFPFRTSIH